MHNFSQAFYKQNMHKSIHNQMNSQMLMMQYSKYFLIICTEFIRREMDVVPDFDSQHMSMHFYDSIFIKLQYKLQTH